MDISRVALLVGSWHRRDRGVILSVADNPQATGLTRAAHTRGGHATYTLPVYVHGSTQVSMQSVAKAWCPPPSRKRAIDLVLLSIGGNDVGFGALAAYSLTESITDLAPIAGLAGLAGHSSRFSPQVSRIYLDVLDERMVCSATT